VPPPRPPITARQWNPRDPQDALISRIVADHLPELRERIAQESPERCLPSFVVNDLMAVATCGDHTRGFVRLRCDGCKQDRVLPFSCKSAVCPSCSGRTMAERAAWLVDRVLDTTIGWRQIVVTFPPTLAIGLCFHADLASRITRLCARAISQLQRARAPADPTLGIPRSAAVCWVQRFSDGLGAWHHLHFLVPDGVFRERPYSMATPFEPQPAPSPTEVRALAACIARRVLRLLSRRANVTPDDPLLVRCAQQPARQVRGHATPPPARPRKPNPLCAEHAGFTVHAATSVAPDRPGQLERLVRYMGRPPVSNRRLRRLEDDRIELTLKRPRRGGVRRFLFEPVAFVARLAALIPRPGTHAVRYYGCLSSGSPNRRFVVPVPPQPTPARPTAPARPARMSWKDLMRRVFLIDVLACPCGGRLRIIAVLAQPDVVEAVAAAIILCQQTVSARAPP